MFNCSTDESYGQTPYGGIFQPRLGTHGPWLTWSTKKEGISDPYKVITGLGVLELAPDSVSVQLNWKFSQANIYWPFTTWEVMNEALGHGRNELVMTPAKAKDGTGEKEMQITSYNAGIWGYSLRPTGECFFPENGLVLLLRPLPWLSKNHSGSSPLN